MPKKASPTPSGGCLIPPLAVDGVGPYSIDIVYVSEGLGLAPYLKAKLGRVDAPVLGPE